MGRLCAPPKSCRVHLGDKIFLKGHCGGVSHCRMILLAWSVNHVLVNICSELFLRDTVVLLLISR